MVIHYGSGWDGFIQWPICEFPENRVYYNFLPELETDFQASSLKFHAFMLSTHACFFFKFKVEMSADTW